MNEENLRKKLSEFGDIVSMRVKAGVKAFGGSICYCQYKTPVSIPELILYVFKIISIDKCLEKCLKIVF